MKESRLIQLYIADNKLNIEQIMEEFTPYIYKIIINRNLNLKEEDIEEIISDVFLAIWKNQDRLDINREMSSYLAGTTQNIINKRVRKLKQEKSINDYEDKLFDFNNLELQTETIEKNEIVINEINNMKNEDKEIFMQYYYNSKSIKEIAEQLKIKDKKVKSRLFRIRNKIKKVLEKRGYSYNE